MTGRDRLSPESRDHGCIHMQRNYTHMHTLRHKQRHIHFDVNVFTPLSYENSFLMTGKHKSVDHNQPFSLEKCESWRR